MNDAWIGVDLDGTLAFYDEWRGPEHIGDPIPTMVDRVKKWLAEGQKVRIFTARVACGESEDPHPSEACRAVIQAWCQKHLGQVLPVTNKKDYGMIELWDDRAVAVVPNTGVIIGGRR
jgi:hypothetical protein